MTVPTGPAGDAIAYPGSMKRVAAAVGEGSSVIQSVHQYLANFGDDHHRLDR
jgi:hypothetical protein